MNHKEKIERLLDDLGRRGINRYTIAPPLYRLLWRLGFEIKPPFFAGFWAIAISMGLFFGIFWGVFMWLLLWQRQGIPIVAVAVISAIAGLCFGLSMACYYRWRSRKLALPSWEDYPAHPP
jgi:membrane associated rhomboid family serine protease